MVCATVCCGETSDGHESTPSLREWGGPCATRFAGCGSSLETETWPEGSSSLSDDELAKALMAASEEAKSEDAQITTAIATAEAGTVSQPNTGYQCPSGRVLRITLIGSFPHVVVAGGHPTQPSNAAQPADSEVPAMLLTADAATGRVCEIGAQTGRVSPDPNATVLDLG
jgi:hypothetical protein